MNKLFLFNLLFMCFIGAISAFDYCHKCVQAGSGSLLGVGPSYTAGDECGFKNYRKQLGCWASDVDYSACMAKKCIAAGKNYSTQCILSSSRTGTFCP
ncbi:uncharacterized protein BX664DRAFT_330512 [Halteromyces radiatus]|uniref:uncharacterized protein n=1 Tax=Halteromyces radiatus TaxID=101107 RepID=UPI0022204021|nr:uncharacterized protein BX664DRAFT_330512 [Halteromyces radiatus]KAI8093761.1 hypothetical protein BX664DRAFT_330512 [Halteromyces radiatus]